MTGLDDATAHQILISVVISGALTLIISTLAVIFPQLEDSLFGRIEGTVSAFAKRTTLAIAAIFFAVIAVRLAALPFLRVPIPGIHDEFSYLLLGDTLAHGRLANPTHPMWVSFETFHVNWFPTYSSMYPPAQGFVLALGQWLGLPWIGVLLSTAAMCAAILWMLQAWMPARWALLGAALVALKFGIASYWMNSYWGGSVAALGGALVLGGAARLIRTRPRVRDAFLLGLGIAILANSRPYEGFLFCVPVAIWLLWWLGGKTRPVVPLRIRVQRAVAPLTCVLILTAAFIAYYNWRVAGNPLQLPYLLNIRTYHTAQVFLWSPPKPEIHYRNQQFEDFYNDWERDNYHRRWRDMVRVTEEKVIRWAFTYYWFAGLLLLPVLPFVLCSRKMRMLWIILGISVVGALALVWSNPHYPAPVTPVIFALIIQAVRHLRTVRLRGRPVGVALSRAIVLLLALDTAVYVFRGICDPLRWPCQGDPSRVAIAEKLEHTPGKHLIMVRYDEDHNIHDEWVFNGAEIDNAKVLWARELDAEQNAKLFAYFKDRHIWLVTPDSDNQYLEPYTSPGAPLISDE